MHTYSPWYFMIGPISWGGCIHVALLVHSDHANGVMVMSVNFPRVPLRSRTGRNRFIRPTTRSGVWGHILWRKPTQNYYIHVSEYHLAHLINHTQGLTLSIWFTCPSGTCFLKFTCPAKIFTCPEKICTNPVKPMYTAGKVNTCPDLKITCPAGHVTTNVNVPWDKIYMPRACRHALMLSPDTGSAWNGRPWPGRSQNWMLMYFIINLSGSQQFSGSSIQNQVELSEWATGRFMHCTGLA